MLGPSVHAAASGIVETLSARPIATESTLVSHASPLDAGAVLRVAGDTAEAVHLELQRHLQPLSEWLGDDPWSRKS